MKSTVLRLCPGRGSSGPLVSQDLLTVLPYPTLFASCLVLTGSQRQLSSHQHRQLPQNRQSCLHRQLSTSTSDFKLFSGLTWRFDDDKRLHANVTEGLKHLYKTKLLPLEKKYHFHEFHSPLLQDADFDAKPVIMLVGQYSTGKTTLIRYLLGRDFPGIRVGPEPTTDRFISIMHGEDDGIIPGNALVVDPSKQFKPLSKFGNTFLNKFQCSMTDSEVLKTMSIIDTPGILSGEKQRVDRGYSFSGVIEWFAERSDRILLLFDAHKLDISDEFKRVIESLHGHDDKIRIILNKADMVDAQQLMRVYGALMWSLGKILTTPEVARVYTGSFWDRPLHIDTNRALFEAEEVDLFKDLHSLPRNATLRKLNDLIKRARLAKVHAHIIGKLRAEMPTMFGKEDKKSRLLANLNSLYKEIESENGFSPGDFPNVDSMRQALISWDFNKFNNLDKNLVKNLDELLEVDISNLLASLPLESAPPSNSEVLSSLLANAASSPFSDNISGSGGASSWVVSADQPVFDQVFETLEAVDGKISKAIAKAEFDKYKLRDSVLTKIWYLADVDGDGQLDKDEFALANYLIKLKLSDHDLPDSLPPHLRPPSKVTM